MNDVIPSDVELLDPVDRKRRIAEWLSVGIDDDRLRVLTVMFDHLLARIELLEAHTGAAVATPLTRSTAV